MEQVFFQINTDPTKLNDINKQVVSNYQVLYAWLQQFQQSMGYINNPSSIIGFLQITQNVFQLQNTNRDNGSEMVELFCDIIRQIIITYPEIRSFILKSLLLSAQESNISHDDIYNVVSIITKNIPSTKQDLLNLLDQVYQDLGLQLNLSSILLDPSYFNQIKSEKNLIPNVFNKIIRLTSFAEQLVKLNGTIVNIIQILFTFCLHCDTFYQVLNNIWKQHGNFYDLYNIENDSQIYEHICQFINATQQIQQDNTFGQDMDEYQEQKLKDIKLNNMLETFLASHPHLTYYIKEQYVKVIDNIMLSLLNTLFKNSDDIIINVFLPQYFEKILGGKTMYTHHLLFPLIRNQTLKEQILNKFISNGFLEPSIKFEIVQNAQLLLISLLINNRYFSDDILLDVISGLFSFRQELENQLAKTHNEKQQQYYIQISRCIMVIVIVLHQQISMVKFKQQFTNILITLQQLSMDPDTQILFNNFVKCVIQSGLIDSSQSVSVVSEYQESNILNYVLMLFGQTNLLLCAEKYLDQCYRHMSDTDLE